MDGGAHLYPRVGLINWNKKGVSIEYISILLEGGLYPGRGEFNREQGWRKSAEHAPPISVARVQFPASTPYVD